MNLLTSESLQMQTSNVWAILPHVVRYSLHAKRMKATPPASLGNTPCWGFWQKGSSQRGEEGALSRDIRMGSVPAKVHLPPIASEASL